MKKSLFLIITVLQIFNCYAQDSIKLTITNKPSFVLIKGGKTVANDGSFVLDKKTILIIDNKLGGAIQLVLFKNEENREQFTFLFDKDTPGNTGLKAGANKFTILKGGSIPGFDTINRFALPAQIEIAKAGADTAFWHDTIHVLNGDTGKGGPVDGAQAVGGAKPADGAKATPATQGKSFLTKIPYYDALTLLNYKSTTQSEYVKILNYYFFTQNPKTSGDLKKSLIETYPEIQENKFVKEFLTENLEHFFDDNTWSKEIHGTGLDLLGKGFSLSSLGGLDVTNIADGFAKFLVKRTKEELTVAFFDKFKDYISRPEYVDMQTVFPETYQALTIIGDEIYNFQGYLQTLRESFKKDLQTLPANLPSIIENHTVFFKVHKDLAVVLKSGCYIAQSLEDKVHPGDILANYPDEYLDSVSENWKGGIQTLQLLSASLRDTTTKTDSVYWVSAKQVKQLLKKTDAFKIFLGLVYQQAKIFSDSADYKIPITFKDVKLTDVLNGIADNYNVIAPFVTGFAEKADRLNTLIRQDKKPANDSLAIEQYYNYAKASIDLLKQASKITDIPVIKNLVGINLADSMKNYFDVAQSASDIVLNISKKNYGGAIVNAVHIYDVVKVKQSNIDVNKYKNQDVSAKRVKEIKKTIIKKVNGAGDIASLQKIDTKALTDDTLSENEKADLNNQDTLNKLKASNDVKANLFKYGSFMAAVVQAQNSDDVQSAIEAFALPSGSSRIKRETPFNVSLNAYTGLYAGYEKINGVDKANWKWNSYGVTAPIGIAASIGNRKWFSLRQGGHWSYSLFLSIIDLGGVAAFRFNNDSTKIGSDTAAVGQSPTIQLKNIISPGLFLSIGIPKSPLSINFGAQMGPNLRKISVAERSTAANIDYSNNVYWRYSISLVVDIPVLNFYTKSK